jgi:hypothetical protein
MERYEQEIKPVVMKRWEEMFGTEESKQDAQKQKGNLEKLKDSNVKDFSKFYYNGFLQLSQMS